MLFTLLSDDPELHKQSKLSHFSLDGSTMQNEHQCNEPDTTFARLQQ
jgi:hypothetical protein